MLHCRFDVMNSKSYSDQANQYKCPLGRHWQIQLEALVAMLHLMESMEIGPPPGRKKRTKMMTFQKVLTICITHILISDTFIVNL